MKTVRPVVLLALLLSAACGGSPELLDSTSDDSAVAVPLGKEDNFLSNTAREYLVEGRTTVVLEEADAARDAATRLRRAKRLIPFKQVVIAWFLNAYISPKDNKDSNFGYGGFSALTKNGSFEELDIREQARGTFEFTFRQEMAGPLDLLEHLPVSYGAGGAMTFDLTVGRVSTEDMQLLEAGSEWFRSKPWADFTPSKVSADLLESIALSVAAQPRSSDAWLDTQRLFADGRVTVGVHFGWDYHSASHLSESKLLFKYLKAQGYNTPVATWDELGRTSGPFTRTILAGGKPVQVEISVFFGKPGSDTDPDTDAGAGRLVKDLIESLETREVVVYSGHSGPFWGFSMGNWKKTEAGELEDNTLAELNLPDTYQIVLAEGCETYGMGQAFFDNPAKRKRTNLDIITTTTYSTASDAEPTKDFLNAVVGTDEAGHHTPWTFGELLRDLDWNAWDAAMYGVHGIDDNPHLHPYADPARFCERCASDADCQSPGASGEGNFCLGLGTDGRICSAECTGDDGCPDGYACAAVARGQSITSRACVPRSFSCASNDAPTRELVINELLADPSADWNGDGTVDGTDDEFVELLNTSRSAVKLGGWTLADGTKVRFTFPQGFTLARGAAVVVFGGGMPKSLEAIGTTVFEAPNGLRLANAGDSVILRAADGRVIDRVVYGAEASGAASLTRTTDGDANAAFVVHGEPGASPGTHADGSPF